MGLLDMACKGLMKRLNWRKRGCKAAITDTGSSQADTRCSSCTEATSAKPRMQCSSDSSTAVRMTFVAIQEQAELGIKPNDAWSSGCFVREPVPVVNVTGLGSSGCDLEARRRAAEMLPSTPKGGDLGVRNLSSESDSGVCLGESELHELEEAVSECGEGDFEWSDHEYECECDECAFARCEDILEDWHISAKDVTLDKVLSSEQGEMVYR